MFGHRSPNSDLAGMRDEGADPQSLASPGESVDDWHAGAGHPLFDSDPEGALARGVDADAPRSQRRHPPAVDLDRHQNPGQHPCAILGPGDALNRRFRSQGVTVEFDDLATAGRARSLRQHLRASHREPFFLAAVQ